VFANITKNSSIIASVVALSVGLGACGPAATVQKKPVGPSPEELARLEEQRKQAEKDQMLKDDLARSLQKREVVVQEIEFVPGVDVEAQKKFREGVIALYSTMDYDLAKQSFEQAVALDKNFLEAYFNLGMIYERTGQREAAIKVYQSALAANPESGAAKSYIGKVYLAKAKEAFELGSDEEGVKLMTEAKALLDLVLMKDTDNVEANNAVALYWLLKSEREKDVAKQQEYLGRGEEFIKNVLTIQPTNVIGLNTRGLIYLARGESSLARWIFENKVLKLDAASTEAHNNLGLAYLKLGDTPKAVLHFNLALKLNQDNLTARMNLAAIYLEYLNYEASKQQYEYVLNARPGNVEATIGIGSASIGMQDYEEGFKFYRKAVEAAPENLELLLRIGRTYQLRLSDFDKAVEAYEEYVKAATARGMDVTEAQKSIEQTRKMQEQMRKMEEQMKVEEADAKKAMEAQAARIKEMESNFKTLESKAGQYTRQLQEKKDAIKANKKATADDRAFIKKADDLMKKLAVVDPAMREIRENIQMDMMEDAEALAKKLFATVNPAIDEAEAALKIEKVQKTEGAGEAPAAGTAAPKAETPKVEEKKAEPEAPKAEAPKAEEAKPAAEAPKAEAPKAEEKKAEPAAEAGAK
jgi:tetratricopeptide (TPR) repeat protein